MKAETKDLVALGFDLLGERVELYRTGGRYVLVTYDAVSTHGTHGQARAAFDAEAQIEVVAS